jgi:Flp pilus assembly protein TadD
MAGPASDVPELQHRPPRRTSLDVRFVSISVLIAIVIATFYPVLGHQFIEWDDNVAIYQNPDFLPPRLSSLGHYWTEPHLSFYVPVTYTLWWLIAHVAAAPASSGTGYVLAAWPFHAANLLAHLGSVVFLYLALTRLVRSELAAVLGAALFAVHPLQVEPVAWASTMYTPLSGCFALAATWAYLCFSDARFGSANDVGSKPSRARAKQRQSAGASGTRRRGWPWYGLFLLAYGLAILTKPAVILVPAALGVIDVLVRRRPVGRVAAYLLPAFLVGAIPVVIATEAAQVPFPMDLPLWTRPLIAGNALAFYLLKAIVPWPLRPDYGISPRWLLADGQLYLYTTWLAPAALLFVAAVVWRRRGWGWPLAALGVFVLALAPALGLTTFDYQRYSTVADRYAYFALAAPAMLVAAGLSRLRFSSRRWSALAHIAAGALLIGFAVSSNLSTHNWHDTDRFYAFAAERNPDSVVVHLHAVRVLEAQGRAADGIDHYRAVAAAFPDSPRLLVKMGTACMQRGLWDEAARCYAQAGQYWRDDPRVFRSLGVALAQSGRPKEALDAFNYALRLNPRDADAHLNAAIVLAAMGRRDEARTHFQAAIQLGGDVSTARRGLAQLDAMPPNK